MLEEDEEEEAICHVCNGSGESPWGPVGLETCWKCGGSGILTDEEDDYADLCDMADEWEESCR